MKLSSISLIASTLAATAGNTIAAPGPLHARSLEQGNLFERDIDSVDLFTRNPSDGKPWHWPGRRPLTPEPDWNYPVGPTPQPYVPRHEELHRTLGQAHSSLTKAKATIVISENSQHYLDLGTTYAQKAKTHLGRLQRLRGGEKISEQKAQDWKQEAEMAIQEGDRGVAELEAIANQRQQQRHAGQHPRIGHHLL